MSEFRSQRQLFSRRQFLPGLGAALALPAADAARSLCAAEASSDSPRRLRVVITGGHPGDPEYGCGGTIARFTDLGHEVVLLYLNRGEWPPSDREEDGAARV